MKTNPLTKLATLLAVAVVAVGFTATASADSMVFKPITSAKAAAKLKVGSEIAVSCGSCHGVTIMTVDAERSYLRSIKCPLCKKSFTPIMPGGGGRAATGGAYAYTDGANGFAYLAAKH